MPPRDSEPPVLAPSPPLILRILALAALVIPQTTLVLVQGAAPVLLRDAPLLLLVLHPIEPWSLLVAPRVDPVTFVLVVVAVRMPLYVGDYFVGRWYGETGLAWLASRSRAGGIAAGFQRLFRRAGGPLLVLFPGATVSVLAGATGVPFRRFLPLVFCGVLLAAVVTRGLASVAADPLGALVDLVTRHPVALGAALAAGVVLRELVVRRRRGSRPAPD